MLIALNNMLSQAPVDATWWAPVIIVIGVVGIGVLLMLSIRGKVARRQANTPSARERIEQVKARGAATNAVNRDSAAEIASVDRARHLAAILDNKAVRLEALIELADTRIAQLRAQTSAALPRPRVNENDDADLLMELERLQPPQPPQPLESPAPELDEMSANVCQMADRGMAPLEIARELDEQVGKVELILALRAQAS